MPGGLVTGTTELAKFFPSSDRGHLQYSLHLPTEGWPG